MEIRINQVVPIVRGAAAPTAPNGGEGRTVIALQSVEQLRDTIAHCIELDQSVLQQLRDEIRPLKSTTRRIQPRAATAISLVATDGGNNQLRFDPFLIELVRVVDSSHNEYCLEAVSPTTPVDVLSKRQFNDDGSPRTALGQMMAYLGVRTLPQLSHMIRPAKPGEPVSSTWVQVYRQLVEWAVVFSLLERDFATDTVIIVDGLLRTKAFAEDLFRRLLEGIKTRIRSHYETRHRRIYLAGIAKQSQVLTRYRLAMALEGVLQTDYPAYVEVPREIERRSYLWPEYARGEDVESDGREVNKFVGGKMFLVKFGSRPRDPIWPVDIFTPQASDAPVILGSMLSDAINGFPVPHYPLCLQKAHESAAMVDFDLDMLQNVILEAIRKSLGSEAPILDAFLLQDGNPAQWRYR